MRTGCTYGLQKFCLSGEGRANWRTHQGVVREYTPFFAPVTPPDDPPRRSVAPQGGVDPLEQLADLLAGQAVLALLLLLQALQVVGQVQRRHDGDALGADDLAAQADLSHLAVQKARGLLQLGAGIDRTGDAVFLVENRDGDSRG